jgi:hypothetical protein
LPKQFAGCRQQHDGPLRLRKRIGARNRFHRLKKWLGFQHHALSTTKRPVVNGAMPVMGKRAKVVHAHIHETRLSRAPQDAVIERAGEKFWKNGDDLKLHRRHSVPQQASATVQIKQTVGERHLNALRFDVNLNAEFSGKGHKYFALLRVDGKERHAAGEFNFAHRT